MQNKYNIIGWILSTLYLKIISDNSNLNTNIETLNINTKLANIPARADVIVGNPDFGIDPTTGEVISRGGLANFRHVYYRNDSILNVSNVASINGNPNIENTYFSCINQTPDVRRAFLNLEIGDEELYLENNTLPYNAEYKVEYDLHLNERNRYYEYAGVPTTTQTLLGIYSKQDIYSITPTGFATFIYDVTTNNHPLNHLGFYGTTTGSFAQINEPLINCCINFIGLKRAKPISKINFPKTVSESFLRTYPNPNNGELLTLNYQFKNAGNVQLNIVDVMGKQVYNNSIFIPNPKIKIIEVGI